MVKLSNSVGNTGQNEKHDVAVIQAILKKAKRGKDSKIRKPYWPGIIDGKYTSALCDALKEFQAEHGVPINGNCPSMGEMVNSLKNAVTNPYLKTLQALPKTALVYSSSKNSDQAKKEALAYLKPATLPKKEKESLLNLVNELAALNLLLVARDPYIIDTGQFQMCLEFDGIKCIDKKTGDFMSEGEFPKEMKTYIDEMLGIVWSVHHDGALTINSQPYGFLAKAPYGGTDLTNAWGIKSVNDEAAMIIISVIHKIVKQNSQHEGIDKDTFTKLLNLIAETDNTSATAIKVAVNACSGALRSLVNIDQDRTLFWKGLYDAQDQLKLDFGKDNQYQHEQIKGMFEDVGETVLLVFDPTKNPASKVAGSMVYATDFGVRLRNLITSNAFPASRVSRFDINFYTDLLDRNSKKLVDVNTTLKKYRCYN
jgi:hypothetical protein